MSDGIDRKKIRFSLLTDSFNQKKDSIILLTHDQCAAFFRLVISPTKSALGFSELSGLVLQIKSYAHRLCLDDNFFA